MTGNSGLARLAGLLYLILAAGGGWAELAVRSGIRVPGDASATAANVVEQASSMRLASAADRARVRPQLTPGRISDRSPPSACPLVASAPSHLSADALRA
jgi:hypothetical protein